ncbi:hypothetical protein TIFTF001_017308 [Ficus carica]|uniref:Uncharacterized protein n=1 Tax=Ficus carica TaxID=3494 RepID=A0AA88ABY9_FICCA|nr:hypothetical protein TIFTF001_017308 [Ficus carica]
MGYQIEHDIKGLPPNVEIGSGKSPEDIHDQLNHDLHMGGLELIEAIENNELHIVIALGEQKLAVSGGGGPNGGGGGGEGDEGGGTFVNNGSGRGVQQGDNNLNVFALLSLIDPTDFPNQFQDNHLELLTPVNDSIDIGKEIIESTVLSTIKEHEKGITLTGRVLLGGEEFLDDLGGVDEQLVALGEAEDGHDGEDGIAADEGVAVLEIGENGRDERLDDLGLVEAAEEAESDAADVLVGMLEVVAEVLADEDHLREDFASGVGLVDDLQVEEEKLLDGVVLGGEDIADDGDEQLGNRLPIQQKHYRLLQSLDLRFHIVPFQSLLDLVRQRRRPLVEIHQEAARLLHCYRSDFATLRSALISRRVVRVLQWRIQEEEEDGMEMEIWVLASVGVQISEVLKDCNDESGF